MYAARIDTTIHTFQASGSLWQDALVMQDRETESLWSQISGDCIQGPLRGSSLTLFPSFHTTYAEFRAAFPNGVVLRKPERGPHGTGYANYMSDPDKLGIFGRINDFQRVPAKDIVYGVRIGNRAIAITQTRLQRDRSVIITHTEPSFIVTLDRTGQTAMAFMLDSLLAAESDGIRVDSTHIAIAGKEVRWSVKTGKRDRGPGVDLQPLPLLSSYWFAWVSFFPDTDLFN